MIHKPVLLKEVLEFFSPKPGQNYIDCTIGTGGHSIPILKAVGPDGKLLGIERDPELIKVLNFQFSIFNFQKRLILVNDNYARLKEIVREYNFRNVNGILFDLGMSKWHLEKSGRGFSFMRDEPLDMRYSAEQPNSLTAAQIVNRWSEKELAKIFKEYGQERYSRSIARRLIKNRPLKTTQDLVKLCGPRRGRLHPATRIFQALRIVVNDELNNLEKALSQAIEILEPGGKLAVITYHSLEDGLAKKFCKNFKRPTQKEIKLNPSSRSAKLRTSLRENLVFSLRSK